MAANPERRRRSKRAFREEWEKGKGSRFGVTLLPVCVDEKRELVEL